MLSPIHPFCDDLSVCHKTDSAFQRYNLVTEEEMKGMKWLEEKAENSGMMDTYMDTKA